MNNVLRVPCAYQGGKQRVAAQIVDRLLEAASSSETYFYDLCCGSAAISIELINRGVEKSRVVMLDASVWGAFWCSIGSGLFNMSKFDNILNDLPDDKRDFKAHMSELAARPLDSNMAELYPVLQASSFGGKQIWRSGDRWVNACFRDYWEPTATSVRRSPANPMQPSPTELRRRISNLAVGMKGVKCINADIMTFFNNPIPQNSVIYVDPPYKNTTGYGYGFDIDAFIMKASKAIDAPLFVSEGAPLNDSALLLNFGGAKGGISGTRKGKHEEWLNRF